MASVPQDDTRGQADDRQQPYAAVPQELRERRQWVGYKLELKADGSGKFDKVPYDPNRPRHAAVDDPSTWGSFAEALAGIARFRYDGPGFVFTEDDPYAGVDLDSCRDRVSGEIAPWAVGIIQRLESYAEVSPSGEGVHILVWATLPRGRGHKRKYEGGAVEAYEQARFFTVTGEQLPGTPGTVENANEAIAWLYDVVWQDRAYDESTGPTADTDGRFAKPTYGATGLPDEEVLARCRADKTGAQFVALYEHGDFSDVDRKDMKNGGGPDWSQADWFIWNKLVFYLGDDVERIVRLAEQGEHYKHTGDDVLARARKKRWQEPRAPYASLQRYTIAKILAGHSADQIFRGGATLGVWFRVHELVRETLKRLSEANDPARTQPVLFVRGGKLVCLHTDEGKRPRIESVGPADMTVIADQQVRYVKRLDTGQIVQARPPKDVIAGVLEAPEFPLPPLAGITEVPVMRPDGTVLDRPGYDAATGLIYVPPNGGKLRLRPIPAKPTDEQLRDAWNTLHYVFVDFPFQSPADRANLLGLLVTLVLRPAIKGHVPLALVDAPSGGTGKGLLAAVVAKIATGGAAEMLQDAGDDQNEWRKRITLALRVGRTFTCVDNVESVLDSPALASMLTAEVYVDRVLGVSQEARIPGEQVGVWCATGNNLSLGGTMPRRCYRIRLDAKVVNPYLRSGFKVPRLLEWVEANRADILWALLVVCRAWFACDKPTQGAPTLGNFERWAEMVWGVLQLDPTRVEPTGPDATCYGVHFLANGPDLWQQGDGDAEEWEPFLHELGIAMAGGPFTAKQVADMVRITRADGGCESPELKAALPGGLIAAIETAKFTTQLGYALKKHIDKRYGDDMWRLESAGPDPHSKVARWVVRRGN